jgi:7-cyano-7-deazaguanine synthase
MPKKAVVLLSGGIDSSTVLYYAKKRGYDCVCLSFNYGQRHARELEAARKIARRTGVKNITLDIKFPHHESSLLNKNEPLRHFKNSARIKKEIPRTYVPSRNTIFISYGLSLAEAIGAREVFIGANAVDYSGYPDCRPEYIEVFNRLSKVGTKAGQRNRPIRVKAPLLKKTKRQIVALGHALKVPFELTWSCYKGGSVPCGKCDSCVLRAKGFRESGIKDPLNP